MSASAPKSDPIPPFVQRVLNVYAEALPEVRFPDLDLPLLQAGADELRAAQVEIERLEMQLETARAAAHAQHELLTARAERAVAYIRVFADGDAALSERVADLARGARGKAAVMVAPGAPAKRRGRPKKRELDSSLFGAGDAQPTNTATQAAADTPLVLATAS